MRKNLMIVLALAALAVAVGVFTACAGPGSAASGFSVGFTQPSGIR